jgi:N-acetylglucosaminyldiphosphoundecaprenol N-acetyl-beta-D-mannosaminyltransferase
MATQAHPAPDAGTPNRFLPLGVRVDAVQTPPVLAQMKAWIRDRRAFHSVAGTGMHEIVEAQRDPSLREILNATDLVVPDGMPFVWLGWHHGHDLPRSVYGPVSDAGFL